MKVQTFSNKEEMDDVFYRLIIFQSQFGTQHGTTFLCELF